MTQTQSKSPFYVIEEFLSPLWCEDLVDELDFLVPDTDQDDNPIPSSKTDDYAQNVIFERFQQVIPQLLEYYQTSEYKGTEEISFEWYPEESEGSFSCENSKYLRQQWLRVHERDLSAILFLSDYNENPPFESDFEVYGGKLEFPQHGFGFNPQRGTLVVFPSDPHFINITTKVLAGELVQARFHVACEEPYIVDPKQFPGDYNTWFS